MRELVDGLASDEVAAVIVISQPGAGEPLAPYVVTSSIDSSSASVQLERTAELAVDNQAELRQGEDGWFTQLARLAIPSGLGGQAPLIADGFDAVAISSAGERPLRGDVPLDAETLDAFGRAVQSTIAAVDASAAPLAHGPSTHLELGNNLVPGWTLSLLALALLAPALAAAIDACARAARQREEIGSGLAWAAARSLPFLGALMTLYALALIGAVPEPAFPFDPASLGVGTKAAMVLALLVLVAIGIGLALRRTATPGPASAVAGLGALASSAVLALWIANPYLALVVAPAAHVWVLASGERRAASTLVVAAATAAACAPLALALGAIANALDLGAELPWTLAVMVADGQIGLATSLALCLVAGALVGGVTHALRGPREA